MHSSLKLIWLILFNLIFSWSSFGEEIIPVNKPWNFKSTKSKTWKLATVPGVVHLDLMDNGTIKDPYKSNNEIAQRWIELEDWEYKTTLLASGDLLKNKHIELVFEGLDTYSTIYLNGKAVLATDNMFREWIVDLKPHLKLGENELVVVFHSPLNLNKKNVENAEYELPAANETVALKVSPYTRKAAYHFGWDWGPRFVTCGIWRPVYIRTWNELRIENIDYDLTRAFESHDLIDGYLATEFEIISDSDREYELVVKGSPKLISLKKGTNIVKHKVYLSYIKNWNPIGYGKQVFTQVDYSISKNNDLIISDSLKVATAKIELVQEKDSIGTSFYFKVNGQLFYAKGANYIPQDLFLPRVDSVQYEKLIKQAVDANINMIRVWGGGIYENDYFYDLCDEYGILVWQDFMFANSMYPSDPSFIANIEAEVEYNVKRLRNHPCIALWCGNNEIEVAWENWGWQKQYNYSKADETEIWNNYKSIFHELIPQTLERLDPSKPYVPSTPLSNWGKAENFNHSSMHYWGVWHGREPIENFATNVGRFIAEYGYQSFPSYNTLAKVIDTTDLNLDSEIMKNRQKSYIGNGIIEANIKKYAYDEPNFEKWVELSQQVQAHAYGYAIRQHRVQTPHCMGTLFWQLNDCWPGPSWSVIDYYGNEKLAFEEVKNYYKPIIASVELEGNALACTLISDNLKPAEITFSLDLIHPDGSKKEIGTKHALLAFLNPQIISIVLPKKLTKQLNKKNKECHFQITILNEEVIIFKANYYPAKNATVLFG